MTENKESNCMSFRQHDFLNFLLTLCVMASIMLSCVKKVVGGLNGAKEQGPREGRTREPIFYMGQEDTPNLHGNHSTCKGDSKILWESPIGMGTIQLVL